MSASRHDGDADRVLLCDETGEIVDGDEIMAIAAIDFISARPARAEYARRHGHEQLRARTKRSKPHGGNVLRTKVGDRYVIEAMMKDDLNVGGEQSGHMIFRDFTTTGDGIVSALQILRIMVETGKPLSELKKCLTQVSAGAAQPQGARKDRRSRNCRDVQQLVAEAERELAGAGRVLLRYSRHRAEDPPAHRRPRRRPDQCAGRPDRRPDSGDDRRVGHRTAAVLRGGAVKRTVR